MWCGAVIATTLAPLGTKAACKSKEPRGEREGCYQAKRYAMKLAIRGIINSRKHVVAAAVLTAGVFGAEIASGAPPVGVDLAWDPAAARGRTRAIDFVTDEGTWMSVDVAPDSRWLAFDLLGHIYRLPIQGGAAENLTEASGVATNFHPAIAPDGSKIAFISDRTGQLGLWVMEADGSNAKLIFHDPESRVFDPAWSPDGRSIVAVRGFRTPGRGWHRQNTRIWQFPVDGTPRELVAGTVRQYNSPVFSPDGGQLYFHVSFFTGNRYGSQAGHRIQRLELSTERTEELPGRPQNTPTEETFVVKDVSAQPPRTVAQISPRVSPDGRQLAFAREMPGEALEYRGDSLVPRTALWLMDLRTGKQRVVMDPITKDLSSTHAMYSYRVLPGYAWMRDGRHIVLSEGGKLRRLDTKTGSVTTIPFQARVHRVISQQARGRIDIDDTRLTAKFLQWPATSPDGERVLFTSVGKLWIVDTASATPRSLLRANDIGLALRGSWSPDGRTVAFTTWDDLRRGHVWTIKTDGSDLRRVTSEPGEYFAPAWSADGKRILVTRGPGRVSGSGTGTSWNPWSAVGDWNLVVYAASGGEGRIVARTNVLREAYFLAPGRIAFAHQEDVRAAAGLYEPFPSEAALRQVVSVLSVAPDGSAVKTHAVLPPTTGEGSQPLLSPDGKWVAFQSSRDIYVRRIGEPAAQGAPPYVETNPNLNIKANTRISPEGGVYHRWIDAHTVEFMSGSVHYRYDVRSGELKKREIALVVPRIGGGGRIALTNAKIITIDGDRVIPRGTIVVEGSRIRCVGECLTAGADRVLDLSGKVVMPGLVDVHAHHTNDQSGIITRLRPPYLLDLAYGVTTIVDPATSSKSAFPSAEMVEAGVVLGPRIFSVGEIVVADSMGLGEHEEIGTFADAERQVSRRVKWGAVSIKNFRLARREQHQKLIEAAIRAGASVTGEGGPLYFTLGMVMDGQTGWEHFIPNLPIYNDVARFIGEAGAVYSPTAIVAGHGRGSVDFYRPRHDFANDARYRRFMPAAELEPLMRFAEKTERAEFSYPIIAQALRDIIRAGGHGAIGEHGEQYGLGSHWEIWGYATALKALEALRVATLDGAYFIGAEREIGSIAVGKVADLVVLNGDPLADIRNTADIALVMRAGRLYEAATLDEIWPHVRPLERLPWSEQVRTD